MTARAVLVMFGIKRLHGFLSFSKYAFVVDRIFLQSDLRRAYKNGIQPLQEIVGVDFLFVWFLLRSYFLLRGLVFVVELVSVGGFCRRVGFYPGSFFFFGVDFPFMGVCG